MTNFVTNMKSVLILFLLSISLPSFASSEDLCAPFKDAKIDQNLLSMMLQAARDGDLYRIKPGSSKMGFCVDSPLGKVEGEFRDFMGGLALKDAQHQGTAMVTINVDSLETDSAVIESMLKSDSFFDSEQHPEILFVSTGMEWISDEKAVIQGNLTLHGITKAVAFYVILQKVKSEQGEETLSVKATTTIQRSEFGMYTLSPLVNDRVSLCMMIDAYRYKS
jgi:polyisoprenoid-binding protein YceI